MNNNNFDVYMDIGSSKIRAAVFSKDNTENNFQVEKNCLSNFNKDTFDLSSTETIIEKIILEIEDKSKEYLNNIDLMLDSTEVFSIGLSLRKNLDGSKLKKEEVQFLIQDAKQQILRNYSDKDIIHIIINNYKINNTDYDYLPSNIKCNFIALDVLFICLPRETIEYFKNIFYKFDISVNQIICSSYTKAKNYEEGITYNKNISFIDIGFNKTSIITFNNNKISCLNVLPIGGNHITKDISKVLKIDLQQAENIKIDFDKKKKLLNNQYFSQEFLQKIIFARSEEILKMCAQSIKLNSISVNPFKVVLMGQGSKILINKNDYKIFIKHDLNLLEVKTQDICAAGFTLGIDLNRQEVTVVAKKPIKKGFFEKFFHFFD